jgi:hypothetical protein
MSSPKEQQGWERRQEAKNFLMVALSGKFGEANKILLTEIETRAEANDINKKDLSWAIEDSLELLVAL